MKKLYILLIITVAISANLFGQNGPGESDYYKIITLPVPEEMLLEVGGITTLPDGRLALSTRRGDVWLVENPQMADGDQPSFIQYASGLHEPLGMAYLNNSLYVTQRGELTKLSDKNGDDRADLYETVYAWPLSGHYHEYSYGPKIAPDSSMFVTTNVAFGDEEWWRGESRVPWRGWTMRISQDGTMEPWATGMRSPCGIGMIDGEFFYTENQGDYVGSGAMWHVKKGSFTGHPAGLKWTNLPGSPVHLTTEEFNQLIDPRQERKEGRAIKPENIPDESDPNTFFEASKTIDELKLPAVILPHAIQGISNSEALADKTGGVFGPFEGQIFVGDQGQSKIMRVALEEVEGEFQGVSFDFVQGFQSGVLRMCWGHDGSLYVGETNRGWGSAGDKTSGLQRVVWTGVVPFEMKTIKSKPDGFEIQFTKPIDRKTAEDLDSYQGQSFTYKYHPVYGSPTINNEFLKIKGVKVSEDNMSVRIVIDNLRQYYIHEINVPGIRSQNGDPILHPQAFYTLNNIAKGENVPVNELSTKRSSAVTKKVVRPKPKPQPKLSTNAPDFEEIQPLLTKNTCIACHQPDRRVVGPAYSEIAKRNYSVEKIVDLIYNPQPQNWPDYATPMAPMPQVPKEEAIKIAEWIRSLK